MTMTRCRAAVAGTNAGGSGCAEIGRSIPRAYVAHYMLAVLDQPDTIGQIIGIAA